MTLNYSKSAEQILEELERMLAKAEFELEYGNPPWIVVDLPDAEVIITHLRNYVQEHTGKTP